MQERLWTTPKEGRKDMNVIHVLNNSILTFLKFRVILSLKARNKQEKSLGKRATLLLFNLLGDAMVCALAKSILGC